MKSLELGPARACLHAQHGSEARPANRARVCGMRRGSLGGARCTSASACREPRACGTTSFSHSPQHHHKCSRSAPSPTRATSRSVVSAARNAGGSSALKAVLRVRRIVLRVLKKGTEARVRGTENRALRVLKAVLMVRRIVSIMMGFGPFRSRTGTPHKRARVSGGWGRG